MKVDIRAIAGGEVQIFSPGWWLTKGLWYMISFKIRGFDHTGHVSFHVREVAGTWRSPLGSISVRPTDEWKEYSFGGQSGCSMKPGQFGIMIGAGTPGCFAVDDVKVEMFRYNPFPPPAASPTWRCRCGIRPESASATRWAGSCSSSARTTTCVWR